MVGGRDLEIQRIKLEIPEEYPNIDLVCSSQWKRPILHLDGLGDDRRSQYPSTPRILFAAQCWSV